MRTKRKNAFALSLMSLILVACSYVPLGSISKLSKVDFLSTDLNRLRVALTLPPEIKPGEKGVVLVVKYAVEGQKNDSNIILRESLDSADRIGLPADPRTQRTTYAYKLSNSEAERFEKIRQQIQSDKAQNKGGTLDISIQTKDFCSFGTPGDGPAYVTIYIASVETEGYVIASRDLDLRSDKATADLLNQLKPCKT
jgi:hypothetical protein